MRNEASWDLGSKRSLATGKRAEFVKAKSCCGAAKTLAALLAMLISGAALAASEFNSNPPAGGNYIIHAIAGTGQSDAFGIIVNNPPPGDIDLNVNYGAPSPPFQILGGSATSPFTVMPGGVDTRNVNLGCNPSVAGTSNTVFTLNSDDPDEPVNNYNLTCFAVPTAGPVCPMFVLNGDGQTGAPNTTLPTPLVVKAVRVQVGTPLPETITWTVTSGNATFASTGTGTASNANVTYTQIGSISYEVIAQQTLVLGPATGPVTITAVSASCGAGAPSPFNATIAAGTSQFSSSPPPGTNLFIEGLNGSVPVGIVDVSNGAGASNVLSVTYGPMGAPFLIAPGSPFGVMPGNTQPVQVACDAGVGTYNGTLTLSTNDPLVPTAAYNFQCDIVTAGPECPAVLVGGNGQSGVVGSTLPMPLQVRQRLNQGAPPPNEAVTWQVISGDARFQSSGATTATTSAPYTQLGAVRWDAGAQQNLVLGTTPGPIVVQATTASCPGQPTTFNLTSVAGALPDLQIVSGDGASGLVGSTVELRVRAPGGGGQNVTFTVIGGSGSFGGGASAMALIDAGSEEAAATLTLGPVPGGITVLATADSYNPVTFTVNATGPQTISITAGDNQIGSPGTTGQPLEVEVRDAGGSAVIGDTIEWQVLDGTVTLNQQFTATDNTGRARNTFMFGQQPTVAHIRATSLANANSVVFTVRSENAQFGVISGGQQSGSFGSLSDQPVIFELRTGNNQPVPNQPVSFQVVQGDATLVSPSATTDTNGRAQTSFRYGSTAGLIRIRATAANFTAEVTATAFAAALGGSTGNNQTAAAGTRLPLPLTVRINTPPGAKSLGGVRVTWSVLAGGGTLANAVTATDAQGSSSNDLTLGAAPGENRVRASIDGVGDVDFVATGTGGAADAVFEIVSGNNQTLPTFTNSAPLVVRVRSAQNQPVRDVRVNWRFSPAGNGSVNPTQSTTDANGLAQTIAQVQLPGAARAIATITIAGVDRSLTFDLNGGVANLGNTTAPQRNIAAAIDTACPALAGLGNLSGAPADLLQRCSELVVGSGNNPAGVREALNQMLPDEGRAQGDAAFSTVNAQFDNLKARIAALRNGQQLTGLGGITLISSTGALPLSFLPSNIVADADGDGGGEVGADFSRLGFFATGTIGRGERSRTDNNPGFDFDTWGLTAGVDYRVTDSLILGAALGYANNESDVSAGQGKLSTDGYSLSGYATFYNQRNWYTDAVLTWGRNSYDITRRIRYQIGGLAGGTTQIDQIARATPDGDQLQFSLSLGRDFAHGAWNVGPFARASYAKVDFDSYVERMSDPSAPGAGLAMAIDGRSLKSLQAVLGGKVSYNMSTSWGILIPSAQIEWLKEFEDDPEDIVTRFVNDPTGTDITIAGDAIDDSYFNLGLGLSGVFANGKSAFLLYERRAGQNDFDFSSLALGVRIEF
jgi:outer membrane autotransporter protein